MNLACIPAYNEEDTISDVVESAKRYVDRVIVCDDGSTDETADIARRSGAIVIRHKENIGYGSAIASLFNYARSNGATIMITLDGDGQHDASHIPRLINAMREHNVDVVIGCRSKNSPIPKHRKMGIKVITSAMNYGMDLKVSDSQSGFRAYSKSAIDSIRPNEEGMSASTEILLKTSDKDLSIAEIPVMTRYNDDTIRQNTVSHGVSVLANTIKYVSIRHPLQFYGIPGTIMLIIGMVLGGFFLDTYLGQEIVLYGSLLASVVLSLFGAILIVTSIILFVLVNMIKGDY